MADTLKDWTLEACSYDMWLFSKDTGNGTYLLFCVDGADVEHDEDGSFGTFASFTIDGREPTIEEQDEYSDDLRRLIREVYAND